MTTERKEVEVRIVSDLNIDKQKILNWDANSEAFTIIAGNIGGNVDQSIEWLNNNVKNGVIVLGYNDYGSGSIGDTEARYRAELHKGIKFLQDEYFEFGGTIVYGSTVASTTNIRKFLKEKDGLGSDIIIVTSQGVTEEGLKNNFNIEDCKDVLFWIHGLGNDEYEVGNTTVLSNQVNKNQQN